MYRQLQAEAKKYVIDELGKISEKWRFDVEGVNSPVVVICKPDGSIIRTSIEMIHNYVPRELLKKYRGGIKYMLID